MTVSIRDLEGKWIVSQVMAHQVSNELNVQQFVFPVTANNQDEALGKAITVASDEIPQYQFICAHALKVEAA
jgi:hypothetical protein